MKNKMRTAGKACFFAIVLAGTALAQNRVTEPVPAVTGPAYDVSTGYTYLNMEVPGARHAHLNGLDASGSIALGPHWGATLDSSFLRTSNVLGTSHQSYMLNTQAGPEFYPFEHGSTRIFVRALGGSALVDGAVPGSTIKYFHGWLLRPSYAFGTGFEHAISQQFALRINGDYLRTSFFDSAGAVRPQNNLRLTASIVFRLKNRHHSPGAGLR